MSLDIWIEPAPWFDGDEGLRGTKKRQKRLRAITQRLQWNQVIHRTREGKGVVGRLKRR